MEWAIGIAVLAALVFGLWLWDKLVGGATDAAVAIVVWPFAKLFGAAGKNRANVLFRTPQRFQLSATPDEVGKALSELPGFTHAPSTGYIAPYYLDIHSGRILVGIGNVVTTPYEIEVVFTAAWPGSCGELRYLRWDADDPDMGLQHRVFDQVFGALKTLDPILYVTTGALSPRPPDNVAATRPGGSGTPGSELPPPPPPSAPPGPGPAWPRTRELTMTRSLPVLPALAGLLFVAALLIGIIGAVSGAMSTSKSELCSAYNTALSRFDSPSFSNDMTDELDTLQKRAKHYDNSGVKSDAHKIDNLGMVFSRSDFTSATSHIATVCY